MSILMASLNYWHYNEYAYRYGKGVGIFSLGDGAPRHDISNNVIDANRHSNAIWASYADIHDNEMVVSNDQLRIRHSRRPPDRCLKQHHCWATVTAWTAAM